MKFNRLGYLAEFGNRRVCMTREGAAGTEVEPRAFVYQVHEPGYDESWVEGMVVLLTFVDLPAPPVLRVAYSARALHGAVA